MPWVRGMRTLIDVFMWLPTAALYVYLIEGTRISVYLRLCILPRVRFASLA